MNKQQVIELANTHCPVCGYYCLGKGGHGCIDKPALVEAEKDKEIETLHAALDAKIDICGDTRIAEANTIIESLQADNTELRRKRAEQQAITAKVISVIGTVAPNIAAKLTELSERSGCEELIALLSAERETGRQEVLKELADSEPVAYEIFEGDHPNGFFCRTKPDDIEASEFELSAVPLIKRPTVEGEK